MNRGRGLRVAVGQLVGGWDELLSDGFTERLDERGGDLWDDGVAEAMQESHSTGYPIIHAAKQGFRPVICSGERVERSDRKSIEQIRFAVPVPLSRAASIRARLQSRPSRAETVGSPPPIQPLPDVRGTDA